MGCKLSCDISIAIHRQYVSIYAELVKKLRPMADTLVLKYKTFHAQTETQLHDV